MSEKVLLRQSHGPSSRSSIAPCRFVSSWHSLGLRFDTSWHSCHLSVWKDSDFAALELSIEIYDSKIYHEYINPMPFDAICLSDLVRFSPTHHSFAVSKSEQNAESIWRPKKWECTGPICLNWCVYFCVSENLFCFPVHPMKVNLQKVTVFYFSISCHHYSPLAMFLLVMFQYHLLLHPGNLIQIWFVAATDLVTLLSLLPMLS